MAWYRYLLLFAALAEKLAEILPIHPVDSMEKTVVRLLQIQRSRGIRCLARCFRNHD
jgi:hypothetical protein